MPRLLQLGDSPVGKLFEADGYEVVTVDETTLPSWDWMEYPHRHFDWVHASLASVHQALVVLLYYKPRHWTLEVPECEATEDMTQWRKSAGEAVYFTNLEWTPGGNEPALEWLALAQPASEASTKFASCDAASLSSVELEP